LWELAEGLHALPRGYAMHPCGVILSNASLLDRLPLQPTPAGYPMLQADKEDAAYLGVEACCRGIRLTLMQLSDLRTESMYHNTCGASVLRLKFAGSSAGQPTANALGRWTRSNIGSAAQPPTDLWRRTLVSCA